MASTKAWWDAAGPWQDPSWQGELNRLFPPGGNVQWLHLYWEPGHPWEPVERWMIGTVTPPEFVPEIFHEYLSGPSPETMGYMQDGAWVSTAPPISRRQWDFYHAEATRGHLLQPYWVLQGGRGGHKYRLSRQEGVISRLNGGPQDTPPPGDLPYCVPDQRTFEALAKKDRVRMHLLSLGALDSGDVAFTEDEKETLLDMRREVWDWLSNQAGEWGEMAASQATRELWEDAPQQDRETAARRQDQMERMTEAYLTGEL